MIEYRIDRELRVINLQRQALVLIFLNLQAYPVVLKILQIFFPLCDNQRGNIIAARRAPINELMLRKVTWGRESSRQDSHVILKF